MKNIIIKHKKLLIITFLLIALGYNLNSISASNHNVTKNNIINSWHPYISYLNISVPQDILKKITPSGMTLENLATIVEINYIEDEKPLYINDIIIANKNFKLPETFNPGEDIIARQKFEEMKLAAEKDSIYLNAFSTYRSYQYQKQLYNRYVSRDGQKKADTYSARPGHSEHQTGLGFDIGGKDSSKYAVSKFNDTEEAKWLYENAHKYGFILRYLEGKESITGYMHESWHYRFVGTDWSTKIYESGLTLEEYLGLNQLKEVYSYL